MKTCMECGKKLIIQQTKFCSVSCSITRSNRLRGKFPRTQICEYCKKEFLAYKKGLRFCSCFCGGKFRQTKILRLGCLICNKKFLVNTRKNGVPYKVTCSASCAAKLRRRKEGKLETERLSYGRKVRIHVAIVEEKLGRKVKLGEIVHHRDLNPNNNSPNNLFVYQSRSKHSSIHNKIGALAIHKLKELGFNVKYDDSGTPISFEKELPFKVLKSS